MGYIPYYNIENPIFLVTGHSLGAAVANLIPNEFSNFTNKAENFK